MENTKVQFNKNSEERRKRRTKFLFVALLLLLLIAAGLVAFLRRGSMQITHIMVSGTLALDSSLIQQSAQKELSGNYIWIIPRSNVLLFSKRNLEKYLIDTYPGLEQVTVSFVQQDTISITVREKKPQNVWCKSNSDCYFIDGEGLIYEPAPVFSDGVYSVFSGSILPLPDNVIRSHFIAQQDFKAIIDLLKILNDYPISVLETHFDAATGDISLRISNIKGYVLSQATELLLSSHANQNSVIQNLNLLLQDKTFASALVTEGKNLQTLDLRFPEKIYYTFKNGLSTSTSSASSTNP
jgi:hypothetical protein